MDNKKMKNKAIISFWGMLAAAALVFSCTGTPEKQTKLTQINVTVNKIKTGQGTLAVYIEDKALNMLNKKVSSNTDPKGLFAGVLPRSFDTSDFELLLSSGLLLPTKKDRKYIKNLYKLSADSDSYELKPEADDNDIARIREMSTNLQASTIRFFLSVEKSTLSCTFDNIPRGRYTVNIFHDLNSNGMFDSVDNVPADGFGISNYNYQIPQFDANSITTDSSETNLELSVQYFIDANPRDTGNVQHSGTREIGPEIYTMDMNMDEFYFQGKAVKEEFKLEISYLGDAKDLKNCPVVYVPDAYYRRFEYKYIHYLTTTKEIPPVLVVGIGYREGRNYEKLRERELVIDPESFYMLIRDEVLPYVEENYSVNPRKRILYGGSWGGSFAISCMFGQTETKDNLFSGILASSSDLHRVNYRLIAPPQYWSIPVKLVMTYGSLESKPYYADAHAEFRDFLRELAYSDLNLYYKVYVGKDHFTTPVPNLVDGMCLLLGEKGKPIPDFTGVDRTIRNYDFSYPVQVWDWSFGGSGIKSAGTKLSLSADPDSANSGNLCMKAECSFDNDKKFIPVTADLRKTEFPVLDISADIYIPEELAELGCQLEASFIHDVNWNSTEFPAENLKAGWNTYTFHIENGKDNGGWKYVRNIQFKIKKTVNADSWTGDIYFDNIEWKKTP